MSYIAIPLTSFGTVVGLALALCIATLAFLALRDSDDDTVPVRLYQRARLARTRMARLLKRRQVDVGAYLRAIPVVEVKAQICQCHDCSCKALCDGALHSHAPSRSRYSFCPNTPAIDRFLATSR